MSSYNFLGLGDEDDGPLGNNNFLYDHFTPGIPNYGLDESDINLFNASVPSLPPITPPVRIEPITFYEPPKIDLFPPRPDPFVRDSFRLGACPGDGLLQQLNPGIPPRGPSPYPM